MSMKYLIFFESVHIDLPAARSCRSYSITARLNPTQSVWPKM